MRLGAEASRAVCTGSPPSSWEMKRSWLSREGSWKESAGDHICPPLVYWLYQSVDEGCWQLLKPLPVLHRAHTGDLRIASVVLSASRSVAGRLQVLTPRGTASCRRHRHRALQCPAGAGLGHRHPHPLRLPTAKPHAEGVMNSTSAKYTAHKVQTVI